MFHADLLEEAFFSSSGGHDVEQKQLQKPWILVLTPLPRSSSRVNIGMLDVVYLCPPGVRGAVACAADKTI